MVAILVDAGQVSDEVTGAQAPLLQQLQTPVVDRVQPLAPLAEAAAALGEVQAQVQLGAAVPEGARPVRHSAAVVVDAHLGDVTRTTGGFWCVPRCAQTPAV